MNGIVTYRNNYSDLLDGIDRVFRTLPSAESKSRAPAVDIREEDDRYLLEAEMSGLTQSDFDVQVHDNLLTVSSTKNENVGNPENGPKRYLLRERKNVPFSRSFVLPKDVDRDRIEAEFRNGLLTLTLHKAAKMQPRSIEIKAK